MTYNLSHLINKQIYIFGLGREGFSTYTFLRKHFPEKKLILIDDKPLDELGSEWSEAAENLYSTITTTDTFDERDLNTAVLFKTPGIPPSHPLLQEAAKNNVQISSNANLFFRLTSSTTIGVTGTKGKSTTAALIHHVLDKAGKDVALGGNIGVPPLDLLTEMPTAISVLELSSHQLLDLEYSPQYAIIQNITPEHLDYYPDFNSYIQAKTQIVAFQNKDNYVLYNPGFELPSQIAQQSKAQQHTFGSRQADAPSPQAYISEAAIYYQKEEVVELSELPLKGEHNIQNILPAVVIAKQLGVSTASLREGLISFQPLSHRLEEVTTQNGVTFVNDSLSTTPDAAAAAIHSYANRPIILIAGGYEREQDFSQLAAEIQRHDVRALLFFKPTGERLVESIKKVSNVSEMIIEEVRTMDEAVSKAKSLAKDNFVVLLSPASASFGKFKDYQDRGYQFKEAVLSTSPTTA